MLSATCFNLDQSKTLSSGNELTNNKILDYTRLKAFSDTKINVMQTPKFALGREKTMDSFFQKVFQRLLIQCC